VKSNLIRLVIVAAIAVAIWGGYYLYQQMPQRQAQVPSTHVRQGDVVVRSYARGELRAVRSTTLIAPNLFGTVQVTKLASLGSFAKEKDLIVEFDDAEVLARLEEKQLEIDQVDERIKKQQADLNIRDNQDQVELLRARYAVRRAELEVKRNELLPAIDQKKNELNLDEAKRRLKQLESDIKSRREQAQAEMAVLRETRRKAVLELDRERQRLSQVKLLSPMSGLVAIRQNRQSGFFFPGMSIPDIREGDQVQPGMMVADILDLSELEIVAKVGELDRANLREGQEVSIRLDAIGEKSFSGRIKSMSGTASANIFSGDPSKKFDVLFSVDMKQLLEGLGAKPEQIQRVLAQAEANRRKPIPTGSAGPMMMAAAGGGGMPGGAQGGGGGGTMMVRTAGPGGEQGPSAGGTMAGAGAGPGAGGGERRGGAMVANLSPEDQKKMRAAMEKALKGRKMEDLTGDERREVMAEVRKAVPALAQAGGRMGGGPSAGGGFGGGAVSRYSQAEVENAKLPPPVDANNQLDVLLRPGLLADVEIIVEKVPNAIHIPNQAVFEKDGKPIVYVRGRDGWEERGIKPLKRSESVLILADGLKPGETVALADPNAKPGEKSGNKPSGGPVGNLPGGGGGRT
jgi:multidrug resistance efflux pump